MIRHFYSIIDEDDGLNENHHRNINNTYKRAYNCGGYALGTFSWYCPNSEEEADMWDDWDMSPERMEEVTEVCVDHMLDDFADLRVIYSINQVRADEYCIAFRVSSDGDFHYAKLSKNGRWYHKKGASPNIDTMTTSEIFGTDWCSRYDGPIVLFAKQRTR